MSMTTGEACRWEDVRQADAVIFERGSTIISGRVVDVYRDTDENLRVFVEHVGLVDHEAWRLSHIITREEIDGVEEPPQEG